jgi:putative membrane protein
MIGISELPAVNATLNATSAVFLGLGYSFIRQKNVVAHRTCMIVAVIVSVLFLVSYITYHAQFGSKHFEGQGWSRSIYFLILTTHTILAMFVALYLAPVTLSRALRKRFDRHKAIARWTLPIWLYVSVTGVIIYFMLYHWYAPA